MSDHDSVRRFPPDLDERRADRFAVGHDAFQFKFDFWQSATDRDRKVIRIVTDPGTAKDLSRSLRESLRDYGRARLRRLLDLKSQDD
jgi:hypothetical protein